MLRSKEAFLEGQVLVIDKPLGWSSFQAVNAVRWGIRRTFDLKKIKVGHAGTLDPLATGLLLICTGRFTKKINTLQGLPKEYTGSITLGATTPSYDLETAIDSHYPTAHISTDQIHSAAKKFLGKIAQKPPVFSALKKDGKRMYQLAREGTNIRMQARYVDIMEFEITAIEMPVVHFRVLCGKGTYIRSLAYDFGLELQSGGHLTALRRTKIGDYNVNTALTPEHFNEKLQKKDLNS